MSAKHRSKFAALSLVMHGDSRWIAENIAQAATHLTILNKIK
jgi:hypothetical protein